MFEYRKQDRLARVRGLSLTRPRHFVGMTKKRFNALDVIAL